MGECPSLVSGAKFVRLARRKRRQPRRTPSVRACGDVYLVMRESTVMYVTCLSGAGAAFNRLSEPPLRPDGMERNRMDHVGSVIARELASCSVDAVRSPARSDSTLHW